MRQVQSLIWHFLWLCVVLCSIPSCKKTIHKKVTPAFYFWKSNYDLKPEEHKYLNGKVLYLHYFDVTYDHSSGQPKPHTLIHFKKNPINISACIPVVFITNETLRYCSKSQMNALASHILKKISTISRNNNIHYSQVQMDCDWTITTRDKYFLLLEKLKTILHAQHKLLSVTLRLHQIKYAARTGIPSVDRGMLMFYNMGDWKDPRTRNSVYDLQTAGRYLKKLNDYPLPLDVALPILRQTIVYRNRRFLTFLNYIADDTLSDCRFLKAGDAMHRYIVTKDTFALGCNFRKGDLLRSETCRFENLMKGKKQLFSRIKNDSITLALFHLDNRLLKHYTHDQIETIFSSIQ